MMNDIMEDEEDVSVPDKRYRRLSYQFFGEPTTSQKSIKGPFVDLAGKPRGQGFVPVEIKKAKPRKPTTEKKTDRPPRNHSGFVGRCLICYSFISRTERFKFLGNKLAELDNRKIQKADDLIEFLRIMAEPVYALHRNKDAARSTSAIFELALTRLVSRPWVFCVTCNAACDRLLEMHRTMKKLQEEVKEFRVKFLNAIKLSKALAEKDPQTKLKINDVQDSEDDSSISSGSKAKDTRTKLSLPMKTVNQVRTCFVGGKGMWGLMKHDWMNYVNLDTEVIRNPEPLQLLVMKEMIKQEKLEEPCTCKCKEHKRRKRKSSKFNQNQKNVDGSPLTVAAQNSKTKHVPLSRTRKEANGIPSRLGDGDSRIISMSSVKVENVPDELDSDEIPGPQSVGNSANGDDNFFEDDDAIDPGDLPDHNPLNITLPATERDINSVNPSTEEPGVTGNPDNETDGTISPKKEVRNGPRKTSRPLSMTPVAIRERELRAKYPHLTVREMRAHLRTLPRRNKGQPGSRRKPIEDLKQSESNKSYVKWRQTDGATMSLGAYKEMKRKKFVEEQKIEEESGLLGRAHKGVAGIRTHWIEKDGKLTYLGVEVNIKEDGILSCSLCEFIPVNQSKATVALAHHIKRSHTALSNGYPCDKCDAKFFYHHLLTKHIEEKHEGVQCPICGLTFSHRSALFVHDRVKHRGIKPHVCEQCGKSFATVKDMTIHLRRHTGERPFVCHVCAQTFIEKQSMKKHIRKYHPGELIDEPPKRKIRIGDTASASKSKDMPVIESLSPVIEKEELVDPIPSKSS